MNEVKLKYISFFKPPNKLTANPNHGRFRVSLTAAHSQKIQLFWLTQDIACFQNLCGQSLKKKKKKVFGKLCSVERLAGPWSLAPKRSINCGSQ